MTKLNIKLLVLIGAGILMAAVFSIMDSRHINCDDTDLGYLEFYKYLRQVDGKIPEGVHRSWFFSDRQNRSVKKGVFNLENIKSLGPDSIGGRTRCVWLDMSDSNHIFAGSVTGGIWKSENAGYSWAPIDDNAACLTVTAITQSPFNHDMIYYTTGESEGVSKANGLGIFRSSNHGESFEHLEHTVTADFDQTWDIAHSYTMDSTIYVATNNAGLFRSTDAGANFEKIYSTSSNIYEIEVFEDSVIMIAVYNVGIVSIHERTLTATILDNGFTNDNFSRISFDYCVNYPNVIYAQILKVNGTDLHSGYKSSNRGKTWVTLSSNANISYNQGTYNFKIGVAPWDSNFVVSGAVEAAYTTDGGETWKELDPEFNGKRFSHVDHHEFTFYSKDSFINGNDGGIYRYHTGIIALPRDLNRGYNVTQYYAGYYGPEDEVTVAGAQDNGTSYNDFPREYFNVPLWGDGSYCGIHQQDPNFMYASFQNLALFRFYQGQIGPYIGNYIALRAGSSNTWFINPVEINPLDGDQLFVSTKVEIYRSNNKGTNWDDITGNLLGESYSLGLSNNVNPDLYVGGSGSFIYRIEDARNAEPGDDEENRITHSSPIAFRGSFISCIKVDPTNPNTIYCGMSNMTTNPRIWRINDANSANPTYESLHSNLPPRLPINSIEIDPENPEFIMIATDYGMYTSNTSGGWWEKEDRIPNVHVTQLRLRHSDRKLFIYTYGRGIWTADLKDNPSAGLKPDPETSFKLYPNPASSFVNIEAKEFSYYALYNSKGDLVATESSKKIIVSSLPNGIYILEVYSPSGRRVKKLIVSH